ncbi:hypothetical protein TCAL_07457 [Tigriopus californicus]|uniref:Transmembrane protein 70 homolog, mitochondrial n=1 Tax=Tigriopus californicus TaxID=6832 RepID=A0A553N750_TIGCA|nr:transmembrane protein 70 homolog, mitochondrial-like [Tigriopus californicus]TRY61265.1 hypothetical protein TCAL_07457 [Tigriopus californicus]|eukprot:TCALIF_07457-PA protein Name:"Similar to CG7506 Transmembrane protein 70 homolog, mitochondrial (Drosophila melanogaster)" AED:0.01 eAED:0.01 QI:0/1/0/1/1/1/2/0/242
MASLSAFWRRGLRPILSTPPLVRVASPIETRLALHQIKSVLFPMGPRAFSSGDLKPVEAVEPVDPADPTGEKAIYHGILATQIKLVKGFSLTTSAIGLSCQPVLYHHLQTTSGASLGVVLVTGAFLSFFTFATPLLIHFVSKKYVTELRYNQLEDTYTAITYSVLLKKKEIKFRLKDVQVPDIPGMFTTFKARNIPLFVDGTQFYVPQHYGKIMGYDKPLNLRWDPPTETQGKSDSSKPNQS